jgi:nitroreductase
MSTFDPVADAAVVDRVLHARRSVRAFLSRGVDDAALDGILAAAQRAPSGNNVQPWRVHVLRGQAQKRLSDAVLAAFDANDGSHRAEYDYYPTEFFEPYLGRRRKVGWDLYGLLGIAKGDKGAARAQTRRNFCFFDAPLGLIFTIDRRLALGSWLDYGMFLQSVMLAAEARGLTTCAQAAWMHYHRIISEMLALPAHEMVVCGMAVGYADPDAVENGLVTERAPLGEFVVRHG